jgi:hypothetical protein
MGALELGLRILPDRAGTDSPFDRGPTGEARHTMWAAAGGGVSDRA